MKEADSVAKKAMAISLMISGMLIGIGKKGLGLARQFGRMLGKLGKHFVKEHGQTALTKQVKEFSQNREKSTFNVGQFIKKARSEGQGQKQGRSRDRGMKQCF